MFKPRFMSELYTEWNGANYVTTAKIYDNSRYDPEFSGCHWSDPRLVYVKQVDGTCPPKKFFELANRLDAVDMDDWYEAEEEI